MKRIIVLLSFSNLLFLNVSAQKTPRTVHSQTTYQQLPDNQKLVLLQDSVPNIQTNIVYATANNFTHTQLYQNHRLLVTKPLASALKKAADQLRKKGIGLLIFDGYRPYSVSRKMWAIVHDSRYVANPIHGSDHNRGTAIDLSLYYIQTGKPLEMPTSFDDFTEKAHLSYQPASKTILDNRNLLQNTMQSVGLRPLSTEWWHFSLSNSREFEVLDLDFGTF